MRELKNVFLDLDNTLICAEPLDDIENPEYFWERVGKFNHKIMKDYYVICERPCLQLFLDWLFRNYKVHIWTAASKDYALFIVKWFILYPEYDPDTKDTLPPPSRQLGLILFDLHGRVSKRKCKGAPKKLSMLWNFWKVHGFNENNTIIIDDLPAVYNTQPDNAVHVEAFDFLDENSENDKVLCHLKKKIENKL